MSYVLEALRRAEAERQRGQVPGVHAVTLDPARSAGGPSDRADVRRPRGPVLAAVGLALALGLGAIGWWWSTRSPAAGATPVPAAAAPAAPGTNRSADAANGASLPPVLTPPPPPVVVPPPAPPILPSPASPVRSVPPPVGDQAGPQKVARPVPDASGLPAPSRTGDARTSGPDGPSASPVPRLATLPESFRRGLPAMAFGGATDSPEPSARMLIINGQLWREGDEVAPGLRLDRITLRSAQFSFRGQRFEAAY